MKQNDDRILKLKEAIAKKRKELGSEVRFQSTTTCILELNKTTYNLHTLNKEKATDLLIHLNSIRLSVKDLKIKEYLVSGYDINEWISDIKLKLTGFEYKEELKKLTAMESKLEKLLSNEKKVELDLDDIENELK